MIIYSKYLLRVRTLHFTLDQDPERCHDLRFLGQAVVKKSPAAEERHGTCRFIGVLLLVYHISVKFYIVECSVSILDLNPQNPFE